VAENVRFGSEADAVLRVEFVRFGGVSGHGLVKRVLQTKLQTNYAAQHDTTH
jgi:hypothetical protein